MACLAMSFLEVGVHATKGELLSCVMVCLLECIAVKAPIVAVVVEYFHPMFGCVLFENKLGGKCFG
jgi:hypothetical protein